MQIRASEISDIIREQIREFGQDVEVRETGRVLSTGDGIARIHGLDRCAMGELLEFEAVGFAGLLADVGVGGAEDDVDGVGVAFDDFG